MANQARNGTANCRLPASADLHFPSFPSNGAPCWEILGLEWNRVDLQRQTAWLNQAKNGTPRGVPLNKDAVAVLRAQTGKHPQFCSTFLGKPIKANMSNKD